MPRPKGKPEKIAWAIIGKPVVFQKPKRSQKQGHVEKQLVFEETTRVR